VKKAAHPLIEEMDLFIKSHGIKKQKFYELIGYSGTYIQMMRRGDRPVSEDAQYIIIKAMREYFDNKKIINMDKMDNLELWTAIVKAGQAFTFSANSSLWKEAFKRYNAAHKDNLSMTCGKCFAKVKAWLKAS